MLRRPLTALGLAACLALAVAGCGSSSSSSSTSTSETAPAGQSTTSTSSTAGGQSNTQGAGSEQGESESGGSGSGTGSSTESGGDNSIQTYGSEAAGTEKTALTTAAHSFFVALAAADYAKICSAIAASNRQELEAFLKSKHQQGGCPAVLKTLIPPSQDSEAQKAAHATFTSVRIKGDTAFVLFTPKGASRSYFVMKREGGAWKAISLAPGTPLNPTATP
jgi:hypothetical protein